MDQIKAKLVSPIFSLSDQHFTGYNFPLFEVDPFGRPKSPYFLEDDKDKYMLKPENQIGNPTIKAKKLIPIKLG